MSKSNLKCCILARVSTELQSLDSQINKLVDEAHRMGYTDNDITIISGKESGVKLDIEERQTIQQMKECIETGQYNMLLIWEVSRLARRPKVLYEVREYLIERHVNLRCMTPAFTMLKEDGTIDPTASIVFALFGTMAEEEARLSKERMLRGRLAKRDQLKYIGGNVMFGYTWDKETDKIYINEDERDTVVEIFERYATGESKRQIAKDLVDRGLLRYDDYTTACVMLGKMLRRPEYAGIKDKTYDYPAIISQELYYKVRQKADSNNKYRMRIQGLYFLQGLIHWKRNGMLMSPYKLGVQYRGWDDNTNSGTMINMNYIESLVWHFVVQYKKRISGPEKVKTVKSLIDEMMHNTQKQQKAIEDYKSIERTIERINERVVKGKMSDSQGDRLIEEQETRLKELDNMMLEYSEKNKKLQKHLSNIENNIDDYDNLDDTQKNRIIRECIRKVDIEKDGIKSTGKIIEIYMIDDTKHTVHMTKRGNYFNTAVIHNGKEMPLDDLQITARFERKKKF